MISEIKVSTVGVTDLAAAVAFYCDTFDYVVHGEGPIRPEETVQLWGGSPDQRGRQAVLGPDGTSSGLLRLVAYEAATPIYWGDYSSLEDYGHYALNIRVPELTSTLSTLAASGGRTRSGPTHWTVTDDLSAWDSLNYGPDGVLLDVFQLETKPSHPLHAYDGRATGLQTVCIHSSDARRSARFYAALGLRPMYDKLLESMEGFFHLPDGTGLHNINMMNPEASGLGRLEIAQYVGFPGRSQRDRAVAGAAGVLSASFETDDLDATTLLLRAIGTEPSGEEIIVDQPAFGRVRVSGWFGPDDERLEFFERL
ncbi:VOC family protein [Nocardioides gilvus]|uniref:VOC family protein n=1 Tax=Nocardioides gilvus TaxID=1735589 RepID=UPI000D74F612|nr:VOC family protein [Nocardioides gilvus]